MWWDKGGVVAAPENGEQKTERAGPEVQPFHGHGASLRVGWQESRSTVAASGSVLVGEGGGAGQRLTRLGVRGRRAAGEVRGKLLSFQTGYQMTGLEGGVWCSEVNGLFRI